VNDTATLGAYSLIVLAQLYLPRFATIETSMGHEILWPPMIRRHMGTWHLAVSDCPPNFHSFGFARRLGH